MDTEPGELPGGLRKAGTGGGGTGPPGGRGPGKRDRREGCVGVEVKRPGKPHGGGGPPGKDAIDGGSPDAFGAAPVRKGGIGGTDEPRPDNPSTNEGKIYCQAA